MTSKIFHYSKTNLSLSCPILKRPIWNRNRARWGAGPILNSASSSQPKDCKSTIIKKYGGFPGGAVVENLPANAGDTGSSPGLGRSHMPRSGWACKPQLLSLRIWSLCSATRGAAIVRGPRTAMKSDPPHLLQLEKALAQKRRPNTAKNKNKN